MDCNDFTKRIEKINHLLNTRIDDDINKYADKEFGEKSVTVTFGRLGKLEPEIRVQGILQHLSSLKDNIKVCLESKKIPSSIVEEEVNASIHLKVLLDIVNSEKHGYPTNSNKSKKNPRIHNEREGLINNNDDYIIMTISTTGEIQTVKGVPPSIKLTAEVYDEDGNFLFDLDTLVDECFSRLEKIAKKYNCI